MRTSQRNGKAIGWSLWLLWTLATSLSLAIAPIVNDFRQTYGAPDGAIIALIVLAFLQWLLLKFYLGEPFWWIVATIAGGFVALIVGSFGIFYLTPYGGAAVGGAVLGFAQWLVLKKYSAKANWWIISSAIAMALGAGWVITLTLGGLFSPSVSSVNHWIAICLVSGLIGGAIKGGTLIWILQFPRQNDERSF